MYYIESFIFTVFKNLTKYFERLFCRSIYICLLNEEKKRLNIWSKDLVYEKTFRLSSHTPGYSLKSCPGQL